MNIDLHIEELVLHGFAPGDRHAVERAIRAELTRLLLGSSEERSNGSVNHLDGGEIRLPAQEDPDSVGVGIARAIHAGLPGRESGSDHPERESISH